MYKLQSFRADDVAITSMYGDRTASNCCAYFLSYVTKSANIIDIGCGPGIITSDLAALARSGQTIGIDASEGVIAQARSRSSALHLPNLSFSVGNATNLNAYADNTFDIVHCHQLLVHVPSPVKILKEFHRICKPGGIIACREIVSSVPPKLKPDLPALRAYWNRCLTLIKKTGSNAEAGRDLETWAKEAGLEANGGKLIVSTSLMGNPSHLPQVSGGTGTKSFLSGVASEEEFAVWKEAWEQWEATEGHEFAFECGEILCFKGE